jgi:hypothetical protein
MQPGGCSPVLQHALKEWAVICRALAEGKQSLLLRKGGIDETSGAFQLEHTRFWLLPTWTHQQRGEIVEAARPLLEGVEAERPPAGVLRLTHWAEVTGVYQVGGLMPALMLAHLHLLSDDAVRKRFAYRSPGLNVLSIRVQRVAQAHEVADRPEYQGCHSWVELHEALSTEGSVPVLDDAAYGDLQKSLDLLLNPTAFA